MTDVSRDVRGGLVGSMIAGIFGAMWSLWGSTGLSRPTSAIVGIAGVVIGLGLIFAAIRTVRGLGGEPPEGSMFSSGRYRLVVVAEGIAIVVGAMVLNATGNGAYLCPWVAFVVGLHFLLFGKLFSTVFTSVGVALVVAAALGTVLGLVTGERGVVVATTALISAVALFVSGGRTVVTVSNQGRTA